MAPGHGQPRHRMSLGEGVPQTVHALVQLGIGEARVAVDDGRALRIPRGTPVRNSVIPLTTQPPSTASHTPESLYAWPLPNGSSQIPFRVRLCGRSELVSERFSL